MQRWHYPGTVAAENLRPSVQSKAVGLAGLPVEIPSPAVPGSFLDMVGREDSSWSYLLHSHCRSYPVLKGFTENSFIHLLVLEYLYMLDSMLIHSLVLACYNSAFNPRLQTQV